MDIFPSHTEMGLFTMADAGLEVEVSIDFKMVLKLFIFLWMLTNCLFIPIKISCTGVQSSFLFYKALHLNRKWLLTISNSTVSGEERLPFISGYKKFITSHKIFALPIILAFKIRYMRKTQSISSCFRLYRKQRRPDRKIDICVT